MTATAFSHVISSLPYPCVKYMHHIFLLLTMYKVLNLECQRMTPRCLLGSPANDLFQAHSYMTGILEKFCTKPSLVEQLSKLD